MSARIAFVESNMSGSGFQALRIAKELDLEVVFLTRNLELYTTLPGVEDVFREYVDEIVTCDTDDPDAIVDVVAASGDEAPIDALFAIGEYHIVPGAEAASRLGLPSVDPQAASLARNKWWCRQQFERAGLPIPRYASVVDETEAAEAAEAFGFPCVVKPADESGSIDVALCLDATDVRRHTRRIRETPRNYRGQLRFPRVLVEEYVLGYEVSVETLTWAGETHVLGATDKLLAAAPHFVEVGHTFPSCLPGDVVAACTSQARDALRALGMTFGAAHVEMRITEAGPVLIEVNARLAGDRIPDLVELATGIPLVREFIRMHLRQRPDLTRTREGGAAIRFLPGSPGVLRRVRGEELARRVPGLVELVFETSPGQTLGELRDDHNRVAYAIASARTAYLAGRVAETALHQLVVDIEPSPSDEPLSRAAASAPTAGT